MKKFQVTRVCEEFFLPGEVIMEQGHVVDQLYFVCHGVLVIFTVIIAAQHFLLGSLLCYNKLIFICGLGNIYPTLY